MDANSTYPPGDLTLDTDYDAEVAEQAAQMQRQLEIIYAVLVPQLVLVASLFLAKFGKIVGRVWSSASTSVSNRRKHSDEEEDDRVTFPVPPPVIVPRVPRAMPSPEQKRPLPSVYRIKEPENVSQK